MVLLSPNLRLLADAMSETALLEAVTDALDLYKWTWCHVRPARRKDDSWYTPVQGHQGLPDIIFARAGMLLMAELKTEHGRWQPGQREWIEASGAYLWTPANWYSGEIEDLLR